jgi:hypothetical protein
VIKPWNRRAGKKVALVVSFVQGFHSLKAAIGKAFAFKGIEESRERLCISFFCSSFFSLFLLLAMYFTTLWGMFVKNMNISGVYGELGSWLDEYPLCFNIHGANTENYQSILLQNPNLLYHVLCYIILALGACLLPYMSLLRIMRSSFHLTSTNERLEERDTNLESRCDLHPTSLFRKLFSFD